VDEQRPSVTAERVAMRRAAHQLIDTPRVLDDPLALKILGPEREAAIRANPRLIDRGPGARTLRAFLVARSRIAEDALAESLARGVRDYVVLGAGLDTFAYRNPHAGLRVLEVDHPASQARKKKRLAAAGIAVAESVTHVPIDFSRDDLATVLRAAGLGEGRPAFFSWLGVTPYLEEPVVLATLAALAAFARGGGGIAFDYAEPPSRLPLLHRWAFARMAARVAKAGEPFRSFFDPATLAAKMREQRWASVTDLDAAAINARCFASRHDGLRVSRMGHVLVAQA
jgi:methyltransferase (TIGR00027 family)